MTTHVPFLESPLCVEGTALRRGLACPLALGFRWRSSRRVIHPVRSSDCVLTHRSPPQFPLTPNGPRDHATACFPLRGLLLMPSCKRLLVQPASGHPSCAAGGTQVTLSVHENESGAYRRTISRAPSDAPSRATPHAPSHAKTTKC